MFQFLRRPHFSIDDLKIEMAALEAGPLSGLTDLELKDRISKIYDMFAEQTQVLRFGHPLFRAVKVEERPSRVSRVSYCPAHLATRMGRLNRAGEAIFYCSAHPAISLLECRPQVGDCYAVSAWISSKRLLLGHLGFSSEAASSARISPFLSLPNEWERNRLIRQWQGRAFTAYVADGSENLYRLPIALKELSLMSSDHGSALDGIIYPSIAIDMVADNVALIPSAVDEHLHLFEVLFFEVSSLKRKSTEAAVEIEMSVRLRDVARPNQAGILIWGQLSQVRRRIIGIAGYESRMQPKCTPNFRILPPDYINICDWRKNTHVDRIEIRTGSEWQVRQV